MCCFYTHRRIPYPIFEIVLHSLSIISKSFFHAYRERSVLKLYVMGIAVNSSYTHLLSGVQVEPGVYS